MCQREGLTDESAFAGSTSAGDEPTSSRPSVWAKPRKSVPSRSALSGMMHRSHGPEVVCPRLQSHALVTARLNHAPATNLRSFQADRRLAVGLPVNWSRHHRPFSGFESACPPNGFGRKAMLAFPLTYSRSCRHRNHRSVVPHRTAVLAVPIRCRSPFRTPVHLPLQLEH